jgi:CDP-diacylglycerol--serine O-phosphatidyltransferase
MIEDPQKPVWQAEFFTGMPAPAGAVTVLLPLYLHFSVLELPASKAMTPFYIAYVLAIAFLMASRIPHFSGKRIGRIPRDLVIPVLFGVGVTALLLAIFPMEVLAVVSLAFLAAIPLSVKRYNSLAKAEAEKQAGGSQAS